VSQSLAAKTPHQCAEELVGGIGFSKYRSLGFSGLARQSSLMDQSGDNSSGFSVDLDASRDGNMSGVAPWVSSSPALNEDVDGGAGMNNNNNSNSVQENEGDQKNAKDAKPEDGASEGGVLKVKVKGGWCIWLEVMCEVRLVRWGPRDVFCLLFVR
jgi:hypothetical protein